MVGVAVLLAVVAVVLVRHSVGASRSGPVGAARGVISDDAKFANGPTAGSTFASISARLASDGQACVRRWSRDDPRCSARMAAAAYATVVAPMLVDCTQPGVFEARKGLDDELKAIAAFDHQRPGTAPAPSVPALPPC